MTKDDLPLKSFCVYAAIISGLTVKFTKDPWKDFHIGRKVYKFGYTIDINQRWYSHDFIFIPVKIIDVVELETRTMMQAAEMLIHNYDDYFFPPHRLTSSKGKLSEYFILNQKELAVKMLRFKELRDPAFLEKFKNDADIIIREGPNKVKSLRGLVARYCRFDLRRMPIQMELKL